MKKCLSFLMAAAMLLALASCGRKAPEMPVITAPPVTQIPTEPAFTEIPTEAATEPETEPETQPETEATVPETTEAEVGTPGKIVGANFVNVREAPGVNQKRVTQLAYGTKVMVYETLKHDNAIWGRIDEGWISMEYVLLDSVANAYYYQHGSATEPTETTETVPEETEPEESKPDESKPEESQPDESKPTDPKPTDPKPTDPKPTDPTTPNPTDPTNPPPSTSPDPEDKPASGGEE